MFINMFADADIVCLSDGNSLKKGDKRARLSQSESIHQMWRTPYTTGSRTHKKLTSGVARFIFKEGLPLYTVEKKGFKDLLQLFDPL